MHLNRITTPLFGFAALLVIAGCSPDAAPIAPAGKVSSYGFLPDTIPEVNQRIGEKLRIEIRADSSLFTQEQIGWMQEVADLWGQAIWSPPDFHIARDAAYNCSPNWQRVEVQAGAIIQGIVLCVDGFENDEYLSASIISGRYRKDEKTLQGYVYREDDIEELPVFGYMALNAKHLHAEQQIKASVAHEIGHLLGIGRKFSPAAPVDGTPTSLWYRGLVDKDGERLYGERTSDIWYINEPWYDRNAQDQNMKDLKEKRGVFFAGAAAQATWLSIAVDLESAPPYMPVEAVRRQLYMRSNHTHVDHNILAYDIMSAYGPYFMEADDFPPTALTLAMLEDLGYSVDYAFSRPCPIGVPLPTGKATRDAVPICAAVH